MILSRVGGPRAAVARLPEPGEVVDDDGVPSAPPRWTWDDTNRWYPSLLADGVRVERAHDLRLAHAILRSSAFAADTELAAAPRGPWDGLPPTPPPHAGGVSDDAAPAALFDLDALGGEPGGPARGTGDLLGRGGDLAGTARPSSDTDGGLDPVAELAAQLDAIAASTDPGRLRLLIAAESAGALAAAEMHHTGLPWRADVHDAILTEALGPRPRSGARPAKLEALVERIREALDAPPTLNPDSHPDLLRAMEYAGVAARSLRKWELEKLDHPVIAPLLEYKSLYRLYTANGWTWLDTWAPDGRFRMEYVVGGVVTGRWASTGGGALQLPHSVRRAVVADPGWTFVVADAAQLEPRVLAGLAQDERMAAAGQGPGGAGGRGAGGSGDGAGGGGVGGMGHGAGGRSDDARGGGGGGAAEVVDMYAGMVAAGVVETRQEAKLGMLGAMYGGTTGASAQVMPRLAKAFPRAIDLVERAARAGERGEVVTTRLGRSSPPPGSAWADAQARAFAAEPEDSAEAGRRARSQTRAWGRFTRNFVVQGTAAEWALCWIASLRRRLWALGEVPDVPDSGGAPEPFARRPHLVFFLHDEVVVHTPVVLAEAVAHEVRAAADEAGSLLFGDFPVTFPLSVAIVDSYADAKD
ncbi:bifunctional 3'-5' exonuclease/DNA polymerase [Myceligenerans pegani]|uniref:DNA-directed DNA polymerase n=1 Tax=Myceligenerans pegani TaxID=2776917 RepID=A0ABR9MXA6_9MICO|nr:bifunctional 3'-5' exonuclease/DNA polymerase [Myceligenerans sp. TRM 65318]MBE1875407.1 bifunctional 3'-5' exonuclease/DNA polymerase [Myceligenerans sp. TRM 65318]MBE3017678.1 bifunctional 3'-5' exonuclease/DNA polymerase [Myceligenerans sp. TRM 65318]